MGERQALHGEGWLETAWNVASDAMAVSDPDGIVLAANPAYYALYGLTPQTVLGKSFAAIFPQQDRAAAIVQYREVFAGRSDPPPFVANVVRQDGTERIVEARVSFVDDHGRRTALLSTVRDVTDEVLARRDALRAEEEQRAFLSSLSHDIKSPLSVIKGHAQVLRRHVDRRGAAPPVERLVAGLKQIEASAVQVAEQIDELVDIARLVTGDAPPLHLGPIDLLDVLRSAIARFERLADHHQLVLRTAVGTVPGVWDAARLERVLDNLLSNAIKYSPEGGTVTVSVGLQQQPNSDGGPGCAIAPTVDGSEAQPGVLVSVTDQGVGIGPEDLPHVFERFRRGGNVATRLPGSGIGLTSVREIVEQHGGSVSIASREGEGTSVSVWLPLCPPEPPRASA